MAHSLMLTAQLGGGQSPMSMLLFFGLLFAVMYFVMIRPQQKQAKEQRSLLGSLKKGDDVVTQGGVLGRIHAVSDKLVTLEVASGVKVRVLKSSIQGKSALGEEAPAEKKEE